MELSVVIPTLNEASNVGAAIRSAPPRAEVVVADGGSIDGTPALAARLGARVVDAPTGRALQMNAGARAARGDVLLFLHADETLPEGASAAIDEALRDPGTVGGAFRLRIEPPLAPLRLIASVSNLRARYLQFPYGDQGLFVRRSSFEEEGGFPEIPFLEDVAMVRRLRRRGRLAALDAAVTTGPRHWESLGPLRTTLLNWTTVALYLAGRSPDGLARLYARRRRGAPPEPIGPGRVARRPPSAQPVQPD